MIKQIFKPEELSHPSALHHSALKLATTLRRAQPSPDRTRPRERPQRGSVQPQVAWGGARNRNRTHTRTRSRRCALAKGRGRRTWRRRAACGSSAGAGGGGLGLGSGSRSRSGSQRRVRRDDAGVLQPGPRLARAGSGRRSAAAPGRSGLAGAVAAERSRALGAACRWSRWAAAHGGPVPACPGAGGWLGQGRPPAGAQRGRRGARAALTPRCSGSVTGRAGSGAAGPVLVSHESAQPRPGGDISRSDRGRGLGK